MTNKFHKFLHRFLLFLSLIYFYSIVSSLVRPGAWGTYYYYRILLVLNIIFKFDCDKWLHLYVKSIYWFFYNKKSLSINDNNKAHYALWTMHNCIYMLAFSFSVCLSVAIILLLFPNLIRFFRPFLNIRIWSKFRTAGFSMFIFSLLCINKRTVWPFRNYCKHLHLLNHQFIFYNILL